MSTARWELPRFSETVPRTRNAGAYRGARRSVSVQQVFCAIQFTGLRTFDCSFKRAVGLRNLILHTPKCVHFAPSFVVAAQRQEYLSQNVTGFLIGRIALNSLLQES